MIRTFGLPAIFAVAFILGVSSNLASADEGVISMWQTQVMVSGHQDGIAEIHLHVHDDQAESYYELTYPGYRKTYSFDDLNPGGVPFRDVDPDSESVGAMQFAESEKKILEAEGKTGIEIKLQTVPRTTLYALTKIGTIQAIDGETGETRWTTRLGTPGQPTVGIASNNTRVVAVRGSRVYCLDAMDGREIWSRYTHYAPGGGVAISDNYAYVTSVEGRLQMFPLNENGLPESFFASTGPANFDPTVTASTVSWATEKGYLNVARSNVVSLRYRLETSDEFQAGGTAVGDMIVANSTQGKVYAVKEEFGTLAWEFAAGERLDKSPIAIGNNALLLISSAGNLVALDATRGTVLEGWPKRIGGISEFVGASNDVIYFLGKDGGMIGINRASGATVARMSASRSMMAIPNHVTDRLYVTSPGGRVQCLREVANVNPVIRGEDFVVGNSANEMKKATNQEQGEGESENPFGESDDSSEGESEDPFAGGGESEDPFSGGGSEDPFSGG